MAEKKSPDKKTAASTAKTVKKPVAEAKGIKAGKLSAVAKQADVAASTTKPKTASVASVSKAPKVKSAGNVQAGASVKVTQVKSFIGRKENQALSLKALGLGRIGRSRILLDSPEIRGLLCRVKHLVTVEAV